MKNLSQLSTAHTKTRCTFTIQPTRYHTSLHTYALFKSTATDTCSFYCTIDLLTRQARFQEFVSFSTGIKTSKGLLLHIPTSTKQWTECLSGPSAPRVFTLGLSSKVPLSIQYVSMMYPATHISFPILTDIIFASVTYWTTTR